MNDKTKPAVFAREAGTLILKGNNKQALALLTEGIALYPRYATGYQLLGDLYASMGDSDRSIEMYEQAFALDPQNPRLLFALGRQHLAANPDRAQDLFWRALRYEPDVPELVKSLKNAIAAMSAPDTILSVEKKNESTNTQSAIITQDTSFIRMHEAPDSLSSSPDTVDSSPEQLQKTVETGRRLNEPELVMQPPSFRLPTTQDDDLNLSDITRSALSEFTAPEENTKSGAKSIGEDWVADLMAPSETAADATVASSTSEDDTDLSFLIGSAANQPGETQKTRSDDEETIISDDAAIDALLARYETEQEELSDILGDMKNTTEFTAGLDIPQSAQVTQPLTAFQEESNAKKPAESGIDEQDSYAALLADLERSLDTGSTDDSARRQSETDHESAEPVSPESFDILTFEETDAGLQFASANDSSVITEEIESAVTAHAQEQPENLFPDDTTGNSTSDQASFFAGDTVIIDHSMTASGKNTVSDNGATSYSKLLDDIDFANIETSEHEAGVLEIGADEMDGLTFDASSHDELEEPVLSEEERAELSSLQELLTDQHYTNITIPEKTGQVAEDAVMLPGSLSPEEIASLSITSPEGPEDDLIATEADEGIDYSDILYGVDVRSTETTASEETPLDTVSSGSGKDTEPIPAYDDRAEVHGTEMEQMIGDELAEYDLSPEKENSLIEGTPSDKYQGELPAETSVIDIDDLFDHDNDEPRTAVIGNSEDTNSIIGRMMQDSLNISIAAGSDDSEKIDQSSLDSLISDYVHALAAFPPASSEKTPRSPVIAPEQEQKLAISVPIEATPIDLSTGSDDESDDTFEPDDLPIDRDEATATMAEIFVKQGLYSRAISIYSRIAKKQPGDRRIQTRLAELKNLRDSASGLV
jgi:pilus assembly protein FimV